jgi:hypothetical protein
MTQMRRNANLATRIDDGKKHKAVLAKIVRVLRAVPAQDVDALLSRAKTILEKQDRRRKLFMTGTGPLQIPQQMGNGISQAVEDFARQKQLDKELWYHNESVWLIRSKNNMLYREVQIAAFLSDRDERLFFIPQAYRIESGTVEATKQKVVKGLITSLPLSKLQASDANTVAADVRKILPDAWSKAQQISETDLELVKENK